MKKLHLDLESLQVESFETDAAFESRGTVYGRSYSDTQQISCFSYCTTGPQTDVSCEWSCGCDTKMSACDPCHE